MIAAALDVETGQVQADGTGWAKEEIADTVHDCAVQFRGRIGTQVLEDRIDTILLNESRIEESLAEGDLVGDRQTIVVKELDVIAEQAVTKPEEGGGKLVGDPRIGIRVVALVGA